MDLLCILFFVKNNFIVHIVNPIQTDSWSNSTKMRSHKTDKIKFVARKLCILSRSFYSKIIFMKFNLLLDILC